MKHRLLVGVLLAAVVAAGAWSWRRAAPLLRARDACAAAAAQDWPSALGASESLLADGLGGEDLGAAVACRCAALDATARAGDCDALVMQALAVDGAWSPPIPLLVRAANALVQRGDAAAGAALIDSASQRAPEDAALLSAALAARMRAEPALATAATFVVRVAALPEPGRARVAIELGRVLLSYREAARAREVLGAAPPPGFPEPGAWYAVRLRADAMAEDLDAMVATRDAWAAALGSDAVPAMDFATLLSEFHLGAGRFDVLALLQAAVARGAKVPDRRLREYAVLRLVGTLLAVGRGDEALAAYDAARADLPLAQVSRDELVRMSSGEAPAGFGADAELRFRFQGATGGTLWVSPPLTDPPDRPFLAHPVREVVSLRATPGAFPLRWAWRSEDGRTLASGVTWPRAGDPHEVVAIARPRATTPPAPVVARAPPDGRRRVVVAILDCADWRILGYLRARQEMPYFDDLLARGWSAVLHQEPALTAAAMEALVYPMRERGTSYLGMVSELGVELGGLAAVGQDPFRGLRWFLPAEPSLFRALGAGERSIVNFLFAHGNIDAGRNAVVTGPGGRESLLPFQAVARPPTTAEVARWPLLRGAVQREYGAHQVEVLAAQLDVLADLAAAKDHDLVLFRLEPLDVLTHGFFSRTLDEGQDDGDGVLYEIYRYVDARMAEVEQRLDADDILVLMSDHGIRAAMVHDPAAIFVAAGAGVPPGRAEGTPMLRGIARVLAELLGQPEPWPDTGVAPWATARAGPGPAPG